ncbi:hypothetical protein ACJMK2_028768 [Sinanodonta woodiana]|uniref:Uncharacterized protein n=1 Tax=Sinanodonta woodiana TaxID=1069815 RepID=A0ABD3X857_SINWO
MDNSRIAHEIFAGAGCTNHNMMGKKLSFFLCFQNTKIQIILIMYPQCTQYAKRYTTYVHQNKMVRYGNKVKQKIEFESIATSSKKMKKFTEKLNTAVLGSPTPTPTQQTPQENTSGTSTISPWGLRGERDRFQQVLDVHTKIETAMLSSKLIENNDKKIYSVSLFIFMQRFINRIPLANKLSLHDQLFVTLCGIPISTLHDMFWGWIHILSAQFNFLIHWPDRDMTFILTNLDDGIVYNEDD